MQVNRSMPRDILVPVLGYPSVPEAVEWLTGAFGFTRRWQAGERRYTATDPTGRYWVFSQTIADVAPSDWGTTAG